MPFLELQVVAGTLKRDGKEFYTGLSMVAFTVAWLDMEILNYWYQAPGPFFGWLETTHIASIRSYN